MLEKLKTYLGITDLELKIGKLSGDNIDQQNTIAKLKQEIEEFNALLGEDYTSMSLRILTIEEKKEIVTPTTEAN